MKNKRKIHDSFDLLLGRQMFHELKTSLRLNKIDEKSVERVHYRAASVFPGQNSLDLVKGSRVLDYSEEKTGKLA